MSIDGFTSFFSSHPWLQMMIGITLLVGAATLANLIVKRLILRVVVRALDVMSVTLEAHMIEPTVRRLANVVPAIVISRGVAVVPHLPQAVVTVVANVCSAFIILTLALAISKALNVAADCYQRRPDAANRPIKGFIQVANIALYVGALTLIVAALMERSPLLLLSGLGAMAAVLLLVFKDTILSLVASVQLTSNDLLRVGDWIEMPQLDADGDVVDIALHTVKVQNWDKTITAIPTHRLITESFKNWRGMKESGGRRIKRSIMLDQTSVRFLSEDEIADVRRFSLLDDYLDRKQAELEAWNADHPEAARDPVNARRITNLGTFRAYVVAYLRSNLNISKDMTLMVRQRALTPSGLPLEIYCFTNTTDWVSYEGIQADVFDHLLAILAQFGLRVFQEPGGADLRHLIPGNAGAPSSS